MQVIFTEWHMVTLDIIPSFINIFLQKRNSYGMGFTLQAFLHINITG